jgi:hypothetical protein
MAVSDSVERLNEAMKAMGSDVSGHAPGQIDNSFKKNFKPALEDLLNIALTKDELKAVGMGKGRRRVVLYACSRRTSCKKNPGNKR